MSTALFNGGPVGDELALSRGLHYGDGVFRTLLWWKAQPADWFLQHEKLAADCERLGLRAPDAELLLEEAHRLCAGADVAVLKIICMRRAGGRGYVPQSADCDRLLILYPAPAYPHAHWELGVAVARSAIALSAQPLLAGVKHLNRLEQVLASQDWPDGISESLMCDGEGRPVCGTRSNLFWVQGEELHTPDLTASGVAGIMRKKILSLAQGLSMRTVVQSATWQELEQAQEMFLSNSLIGIWPVCQLGQRRYPVPGRATRSLMAQLRHPWAGS